MKKASNKKNTGVNIDQDQFSKTEKSIFNLMKSGKWFRSTVIKNRCAKGCTPETALRRLRDLRSKNGVEAVETRRPSKKSSEWAYRLILND